jgi:hypothetical protein
VADLEVLVRPRDVEDDVLVRTYWRTKAADAEDDVGDGVVGSEFGLEMEVVEGRDGVIVASSSTAGDSGDVEAHGELELSSLAAVLKDTRGPLGELEGMRVGVDLSCDHGATCQLEEEGPQI